MTDSAKWTEKLSTNVVRRLPHERVLRGHLSGDHPPRRRVFPCRSPAGRIGRTTTCPCQIATIFFASRRPSRRLLVSIRVDRAFRVISAECSHRASSPISDVAENASLLSSRKGATTSCRVDCFHIQPTRSLTTTPGKLTFSATPSRRRRTVGKVQQTSFRGCAGGALAEGRRRAVGWFRSLTLRD